MSQQNDDNLSHVDENNLPRMVDVSDKMVTKRTAAAQSTVELTQQISDLLEKGEIHSKKGPVFQTAIIAGTMAAKKTAELIPFCHPLGLDSCIINIENDSENAIITCTASVEAKTGVEMEAITGASIAALTIYDMCKGISHDLVIKDTRLIEKTGGKSDYRSKAQIS